ncbi:hypothetical protein CYMTET_40602 [Cymbomonas tetramitiformis]|uniref:DUF659 domain-containing protein n=1 Tax=Cymbomonas tetramitiformis TaxID=36881 RepID=A0AAE0F3G7_9CHLO|nr:hypothetical protein CYMTET_40602 [Cymbomonas tetramitiformis]
MEAFSRKNNMKGWAAIGLYPFNRCVYWELVDKDAKAVAAVSKAPRVNLEVSTFGFKGKEARRKDTEDGEAEVEEEQVAEQKKPAATNTQVRKRQAAVKEMERSAKYAKLAEGARKKVEQARNHVKLAKLVKEELVGMLKAMGETPATSAKKAAMEALVQQLLGVVQHSHETEVDYQQRNESHQQAKARCIIVRESQKDAKEKKREREGLNQATAGVFGTAKARKQTSIQAGFMGSAQKLADEALAHAFYTANVAPNVLDNLDFKRALQKVALVGPAYTAPSRHAVIAGPMLTADADRVKALILTKRAPIEKFGSTIVSDVATDGCKRPINNLIDISAELAELVKAEDCTGKTKDKQFIADFVIDYVKSLQNPFSVVQVLMDNATRGSWPLIEAECPWVSVGPCEPHVSSLEVADISKLPFFKAVIKKVHVIRKFILNHQKALATFKSLAEGMLTQPGATREATVFYGFTSFLQHIDAITQTLTSQGVVQYVRANRGQRATPESRTLHELYSEAKDFASEADLQPQIELCLQVLTPIVKLLRLADSDRPSASKIQYHKFEVQEILKGLTCPDPAPWEEGEYEWDEMLQEIVAIHRYRWDYGYTIVQGTGYLLDPEFVDMDQHQDHETMVAFTRFVEKTYPMPPAFAQGYSPTEDEKKAYNVARTEALAKRSAAETQLLEYKLKRGVFSRETVWETAKIISAADFWYLYGSGVKELQLVGMRATAQVAGSELLWTCDP